MVWGAFTGSGTLEIQFTSTKIKSSDYIAVLQSSLLPFFEQNREIPYIFQQDNARIQLVRRVYANNRHFDTTDELKGAIIAEWNLLELSLLKKLVSQLHVKETF